MAIITISHKLGAGGPEIGMAVAERLGFRYVDQEMIIEAARRYGVGEERLTQLDESKPSLFERFDAETRLYLTVLQTALYDVAEGDHVVIMGRGGQYLLRGIPHALRTLVIAPFELRVKRVMKKMASQMGEVVDARTAAEIIRRNDAEKAGRMRYLYEVDWTDPELYDLILNTETLTIEGAVETLIGLVRRPEMATTEEGRQQVANRALASRVRAALAAHPETRKYRINVEVDQGVVQLEGTAALDKAIEVARAVPGVVDVKGQILEVPPIPPFVA